MPASRSAATLTAMRVERYETLVIGGGQAGLAVGMQLSKRGVDFAILSDEKRIGDNWRRRWDSLRLFTPARYSGLPSMLFPAAPAHLADKDEVADYLERYAERFDLPVRLGSRVRALTARGTRFQLLVDDRTAMLEADNVVVATGPLQTPRIPAVRTHLSDAIHQLHSSEYRNPFALPEGPVLVVGAGNSGAQIAMELSRFRKVWLAGSVAGHMPRRLLGRDIFDWIWPIITRASVQTRLGRRMRANTVRTSDARIGLSERDLRSSHVQRVGRVTEARGGLPVCGDEVLNPRVVIWCTGFQPDYRWIDLPGFDATGGFTHERGVISGVPGLYFLGLRFQHRLNSSLIGGVGEDAEFIAEHISRRSEAALLR
ncbi:NAD(P)/FAD-dependent oxidoreductase [Gemmatimonas sp.]|uniref:flavin-containing monooxygenase n=1 Tax=Gemmatimonas sp. TaxID=1962908 RepID=UPI00286A58B6|nr:NAD(P)/FAD-dependent oxidoreductase [Gemmatimonas sp.]